jgi:fucose permease
MVEYLVQVRQGDLAHMGNVPAALWGGIFFGRLLLAEPTHRYGEKPMLTLYCIVILAMQLVFWLVPNIIAGAISLGILGFFFGPLFATVRVPSMTM